MNTMLIVLLALASFVTLCDAFCTYIPLEIILGATSLGCQDDTGKIHKFNTQWDNDCVHCLCREDIGIICCNMIIRPKLYDRTKCTEVFNKKKCSYEAVNKNNPSELCEVSYYVG